MLVQAILVGLVGAFGCLDYQLGTLYAFAANLVCMSEVVLAPCWSALLFGEVFRWNEFLGAAIIVLVIVGNLAYDAFGDGFLVALVRHRNKERA